LYDLYALIATQRQPIANVPQPRPTKNSFWPLFLTNLEEMIPTASVLNVGDIIWSVDANAGTQTFTTVFVDGISAANVVTTLSTVQILA